MTLESEPGAEDGISMEQLGALMNRNRRPGAVGVQMAALAYHVDQVGDMGSNSRAMYMDGQQLLDAIREIVRAELRADREGR